MSSKLYVLPRNYLKLIQQMNYTENKNRQILMLRYLVLQIHTKTLIIHQKIISIYPFLYSLRI